MTRRTEAPTPSTESAGSSRLVAARVVAALSAVLWGFFFFGLIDLAVPIDETPGFYDS